MSTLLRTVVFKLYRGDGSVTEFSKPIFGDDEMVQWTVEQFAEVNGCGAEAFVDGQSIAKAGKAQ